MPDPHDDLYAVLGVAQDASPDQISQAFRVLVRRHHPDTRASESPAPAAGTATAPRADTATAAPEADTATADEDAAVRDVVAAYAVLHDPRRRAEYDEQRRAVDHQPRSSAPGTPKASGTPKTQNRRRRPPATVTGPPVVLGELSTHQRQRLLHWIVNAGRHR